MREATRSSLRRLAKRLLTGTPSGGQRRRYSLSGKKLPDDHQPAPMWEDLVRPGPKPAANANTIRKPWNGERPVARQVCVGKDCRDIPGHDGGVHDVPRRLRSGFSFDTVHRSPRMRHGVDDEPRTSVALRQLRRERALLAAIGRSAGREW